MRLAKFAGTKGSRRSLRYSLQEDDEKIETLEALTKVLTRPLSQRTVKSLHSLIFFVKQIKFFKQLAADLSEDAVAQCCLNMTYERKDEGEVVFRQGDQGSKFYVMLEGKASVSIEGIDESGGRTTTQVAIVGKGDSFGELALLNNKPRAATIGCLSESHFAVLDKADYVLILSKLHEAKMFEKIDFLLSLPIFRNWTRGSMQKLTFYFAEHTYQRKSLLCKVGDPPNEVHFIRQGEVEVLREVQTKTHVAAFRTPKTQRTRSELAILGVGESIGHEEVLMGTNHRFTYVCHSCAVKVLTISREDFLKRVNTEESWNFLKALSAVKGDMRQQRISSLASLETLKREGTRSCADTAFTPDSVGSPQSPQTPVSLVPSGSPPNFRKKELSTLEKVVRLYPFRQTVRESVLQHKATAIRSFRRLKSWDVIFTRKTVDLKDKKGKPLRSVVNIHTHRLKSASTSDSTFLSFLAKSQSRAQHSPSTSISSKPCLTINSIEVTHLSGKDDLLAYPKPEKVSETHWSSRRFNSTESMPKFNDFLM